MMGRPRKRQAKLFYTGWNLSERIPDDHPLRRIRQLVPFDTVRSRVADCYGYNGHEGLDPALILKLLFLLFYENVRSERELMRQLPMRLDWLWFCELDLDDPIPHHSVLSKARRRWGLEIFEEVFAEVLRVCVSAGLVDAQTVYADATVLKADASVDSRIPRCLWQQLEAEASEDSSPAGTEEAISSRTPPPAADRQADQLPPAPQGKFNAETVSRTDPDATTTCRPGRGVMVGYQDHSLVDDRHGVVLATVAAPADYDEAAMLEVLLDKQELYIGHLPQRVVGDSAYGTRENLTRLRARRIQPYLKRRGGRLKEPCDWRHLPDGCDPQVARRLMTRRLWRAEGRFAEAHVRYGHRRCRWRRRWRVQIQCYLVAMVQNVGKLLRYGNWPRLAGSCTASISSCLFCLGKVLLILRNAFLAECRRWILIRNPS